MQSNELLCKNKGAEEIAAFKEGKGLGHGPDSKKFCRTLKRLVRNIEGRRKSEDGDVRKKVNN